MANTRSVGGLNGSVMTNTATSIITQVFTPLAATPAATPDQFSAAMSTVGATFRPGNLTQNYLGISCYSDAEYPSDSPSYTNSFTVTNLIGPGTLLVTRGSDTQSTTNCTATDTSFENYFSQQTFTAVETIMAEAQGNNQAIVRVDWGLSAGPVIFNPASTNGPTGDLDTTAYGFPPIAAPTQELSPTETVTATVFSIYPQPAPSQKAPED